MRKFLPIVLFLVALPSCAALGKWVPRAQFSIGAFGVTLAVDTRTMTDAVGEVAVSVSDLVLPQPPAANAGLPAPAPAPAPAVEPAK